MIAIVTEKVWYEQKDYGSKNIDAHYLTQTKKSMFVQHLHSITRVYMFVFILLLASPGPTKKHEHTNPSFF